MHTGGRPSKSAEINFQTGLQRRGETRWRFSGAKLAEKLDLSASHRLSGKRRAVEHAVGRARKNCRALDIFSTDILHGNKTAENGRSLWQSPAVLLIPVANSPAVSRNCKSFRFWKWFVQKHVNGKSKIDSGPGAERRVSAARLGPYSSKRVTAALRLRTRQEQPTRQA